MLSIFQAGMLIGDFTGTQSFLLFSIARMHPRIDKGLWLNTVNMLNYAIRMCGEISFHCEDDFVGQGNGDTQNKSLKKILL